MNSDDAFDVIEAVTRASGHAKLRLLRDYPGLAPFVEAAYDPYTKYYMTSTASGSGDCQFDSSTWNMLDLLHKRVISGSHGHAMLDSVITGMTYKSAEILKRILNKDLRMGMGAKSINKVYPRLIPTHDVMLAKIFDKRRVKFPCFGSPKIDGVRAIYRDGRFYSRNGHIYEGLEVLQEQLKDIKEPIDGELTVPGKTFQEGSGLIRRSTSTPTAMFNMFELPSLDMTFRERLISLEDLNLFGDNVVWVPHRLLYDMDQIMDYYHTCRDVGYEGVVIKPLDYEYKGTRSYNWMKMKNIISDDLVVTGVFEGEGKYVGQLGGIVVDFHGTSVRVGGGFSDSQRCNLWGIPESVIGRVAEVLYMEVTDGGSLRHPRFIQFRPDKESTYGGVR